MSRAFLSPSRCAEGTIDVAAAARARGRRSRRPSATSRSRASSRSAATSTRSRPARARSSCGSRRAAASSSPATIRPTSPSACARQACSPTTRRARSPGSRSRASRSCAGSPISTSSAIPTAGPFAHVTALFRRDADGWFHVYVQQELGHYVAEAVLDALAGLESRTWRLKEIFFPKRMWRPRPRAQAPLRGRHRRRRLARARDRVLPREAARDHGRRDPREVVHRLGRLGPQHDDHPLELPHARGRGVLRRERAAVRAALGRARLQPHVLPARAPDARALGPGDDHDAGARRGQQAARDQVERRSSRRGSRELCPELDLSQRPAYPIVGALYHPPGGIIRHDAVVWGFARAADRRGVEIHQNTEVTGFERERRPRSPRSRRPAAASSAVRS